MKDSGVEWIGEIPKNWSIVPVKAVFKSKKTIVGSLEKDFQRLALTLDGVIPREKIDSNGLQPANFETYQIVRKKDLIFKLIDLENIKTSRVGLSEYEGIVSPVYIRLVNERASEYGFWYFYDLWNQNVFNVLGSGVRSNLTSKDLLNLPFIENNNSMGIVRKIKKEVKVINSIVAKTKQSIEELKKYKQSLITEVVTKGLDKNVEMKDSGIKIIGDIKKSYKIIPLKYIGSFQNGISKPSDYFGEGDPFISYGDVYNNRALPKNVIGLAKSSKQEQIQYSVEEGDIFFTRTSETLEEIAFSSICFKTIPKAVFSGFVIRFRPYKLENINLMFLSYYLESEYIRHYFAREMNIVTRASLSQSLLGSLPIIQPSIEEQQEIVDYIHPKIKNIDSLIRDKYEIIKEYESYKKSLIYEYVTGKKEVGEEVE